ncbi:MAG: prolipoprotein diacylglyceryl transferase family protein [Bacteroidales bacterium]
MIHISAFEGADVPRLFYTGSFFAVFCLVIFIAKRRHYPLFPCFAILATTSLSAMIGGRLMAFSPDDWKQIVQHFIFPATQEKRLLGYLIFGFIGFSLSTSFLRFRNGLYEILAYGWLLRLIIARTGCLLGGCCYGIPTGTGWGISYSANFPAFQDQMNAGLLPAGSVWSLPVHPTQLYEIISGILIVLALLFIQRKKLMRNGLSLFLASVAMYGGLRFLGEFMRAPQESGSFLHPVQWIFAGLFLVLPVLIWFIESGKHLEENRQWPLEELQSRSLLVSSGVLLAIALLIQWFSPFELIICTVLATTLIIAATVYFFYLLTHRKKVRMAIWLFLSVFLFSAQKVEVAGDSLKTIGNYFMVGAGGMTGSEPTICGGYSEYSAGGASVSYNLQDKLNHFHQFGADVYRINYSSRIALGFSPYYTFSGKWIGAGVGLNYADYESNLKNSPVLPRLKMRIGRQDKYFFESMYHAQFPSGLPVFQAGMGFGILKNNNFYPSFVRIGVSDIGFYVNPNICVDDQLLVDPYFFYGGKESYQVGINLHFLLH